MAKRFYIEKQHDVSDCGAACLASISKYYGVETSLTECRELTRTDTNGTSFYGLSQGAGKLGYTTEGLSGSAVELLDGIYEKSITLPVIARIIVDGILEHYVVVYKIVSKYVLIGDPASGKLEKISHDKFFDMWQGQIMTFKPQESKKEKQSILAKSRSNLYLNVIFKNKSVISRTLLVSAIVSVLALSSSFVIERIVDGIQGSTLDTKNIALITFILLGITGFQVVFGFLRGKMVTSIASAFENDITKKAVSSLIKLPMTFFENHKNGDVLSKIMDINKIISSMLECSISLVLNSFIFIVCETAICLKNPILFLISLILILTYSAVVFIYNNPIRSSSRNFLINRSEYTSAVKDVIDKIDMIKTYSCESYFEKKINDKIDKSIEANRKNTFINLHQNIITTAIASLGTILLLGTGSYMVLSGRLTLGELILAYTLTGYVVTPINQILSIQPKIIEANEAAKRLDDILLGTHEDSAEKLADYSLKGKDISINDLKFRYGYRNYILNDINMQIKGGNKVAFVGKSGCGKTTLAKLLIHFYDIESENGNIKFGDIDLNSIPISELRNKAAYISQKNKFIRASIRDNITMGRTIPEEEILRTFYECGCIDFLKSFPMGLDTILDEDGANLSEGQKQKLAVIRTIVRKPDIIIADEATSNLDSISEKEIYNALQQYCTVSNATLIVITHKLSLVENCDQIFVMNNGNLIGEGKHEELISNCDFYNDLWSEQSGNSLMSPSYLRVS